MRNHGLTLRQAMMYLAVQFPGDELPAPSTIRCWLTRGQVERTKDGMVDPLSLHDWFQTLKDRRTARSALDIPA